MAATIGRVFVDKYEAPTTVPRRTAARSPREAYSVNLGLREARAGSVGEGAGTVGEGPGTVGEGAGTVGEGPEP